MNLRTIATAASTVLAAILAAHAGTAGEALADPPAGGGAVPEGLQPPAGQNLVLTARGTGVQIYECGAAKEGPAQFSWIFKAPEADLADASGRPLGKHYAGPTWEAGDGSKVVGEVVAKHDAPVSSAIPWLLLRAKSTSGSGIFTAVASIQRLHTVGGGPPRDGCDAAQLGRESRVPYSAVYRFYAARR
jgi:hypothetical protein